jgi:hypothetical protein
MIVHQRKNGGPKKKFWFSLAISIMLVSMMFAVYSNCDLTSNANLKSEYHQEPQEKSIATIENEHEDYRSLLGTTESADVDNDNEMEIVFGNSEGYVYGVGTENQAQEDEIPTAYIDSISPSVSKEGEYVTFIGHGIDEDGDISEYLWESDIDGFLSEARSFTTPDLSEGTHVISFRVRDNTGDWSEFVQSTIVVEEGEGEVGFDSFGISEDPWLLLLLIIVILVIIVAIVALLFGRKGKEEEYQVQIGGFDNLGTRSRNR